MKKTLMSLAILAGLVGCFGCQHSLEPKAQAQAIEKAQSKPCETDADCEKPAKVRHYCVGKTKAGARCRKSVKHEGDYCWMHASQKKK